MRGPSRSRCWRRARSFRMRWCRAWCCRRAAGAVRRGARQRDGRGADAVAVRDRREPLHVHAEQAADRGRLGVAQLGELLGDVLHRAVVLAQLHARADLGGAGGVPVVGQCRSQGRGPLLGGQRSQLLAVARLQLGDAGDGERLHGLLTAGLGEEAQRRGGEVVVAGRAGGVPRVGEHPQPGRPAAAAQRRADPRLPGGDRSVGQQGVQVPSYGGRGQPEAGGQRRGGGRPELEQQRAHALARARTLLDVCHGFHNTSVP